MSSSPALERWALRGIVAGVVLVFVAYLTAWLPAGTPTWGVATMIAGCALMLACATALGALRSGVRRRFVIGVAVFLLLVVVTGLGLPLFLPAGHAGDMLLLGLPVRTAIEVYGVGLLPLVVVPVVFAIEFKRTHR